MAIPPGKLRKPRRRTVGGQEAGASEHHPHPLSKIPCEEIKRAKVALPKRRSPGKYKEPDYPYKYVPVAV